MRLGARARGSLPSSARAMRRPSKLGSCVLALVRALPSEARVGFLPAVPAVPAELGLSVLALAGALPSDARVGFLPAGVGLCIVAGSSSSDRRVLALTREERSQQTQQCQLSHANSASFPRSANSASRGETLTLRRASRRKTPL
eukprot:CAMPEP_0180378180 /NCGR_PEP_ID=MMETSP0989-20121125/24588_1 /TAXON_ID=697907 /ORGANISM="non described non described, Strain CCMP2293" /LENGTH=143 /DNA_ID=CAMNT_0022376999 /DNA_START=270 /DNA_END=700 /DNA_ORIENTATION=+